MTVEQARAMWACPECGHACPPRTLLERASDTYRHAARYLLSHVDWCPIYYPGSWLCRACVTLANHAEAASVAYDMAVAAESDDRIRATVAY